MKRMENVWFQYSRTRLCYSFGLHSAMHAGKITPGATRLGRQDYAPLGIVVLATALFSLAAYRPFQLYFFGDTWDILCEFHEQGWRTIWRMHNEHFMPVSKAVLYLQYALFGMHNFPYQAVNIFIHSTNAALLYVVSAEFAALAVARVFGALFFAFSGVYWEVTMWEAGQQTTLALLFILLSLIVGSRYLRRGEPLLLAVTMCTALLASWSMGFGLLVVPLLAAQAAASRRRTWKRVAAICTLPAVTIMLGFTVLLRSDRGGLEHALSQASVRQALQVIPWAFTAMRGLAASYRAPLSAPLVLSIIFSVAGLFFWRRFLSKDRMFALLVPLSMLLLPYALTAVGRVQLGIPSAASSRYQYLPAAALGLILAWLAEGVFSIARSQYSNAFLPLALMVLLTLPQHALAGYVHLRRHSPMDGWGQLARRFVSLAVYQRNWANVPAGMVCVRPELYLPTVMYPHPFFDLPRALPLYASAGGPAGVCTVGMASVLGLPQIARMNLLNGPRAARIELHGAGGYAFETQCANRTRPYSFAASVRLVSGDPGAYMRIVFKNSSGDILDTYPSEPIASHAFSTMVVSAYPPPETAAVTVGFAGSAPGSEPSVIAVSDAVLLQHPVYLPGSLLQKEITDKHGIDSGRIEAAHGVARSAHQRLAEQVERSVVEHRQPGGLPRGMQQFPVQGIVLLRNRVYADHVAVQDRAGKAPAMGRANAAGGGQKAGVGTALEVLAGNLGRH
jgi:hypothetical protein